MAVDGEEHKHTGPSASISINTFWFCFGKAIVRIRLFFLSLFCLSFLRFSESFFIIFTYFSCPFSFIFSYFSWVFSLPFIFPLVFLFLYLFLFSLSLFSFAFSYFSRLFIYLFFSFIFSYSYRVFFSFILSYFSRLVISFFFLSFPSFYVFIFSSFQFPGQSWGSLVGALFTRLSMPLISLINRPVVIGLCGMRLSPLAIVSAVFTAPTNCLVKLSLPSSLSCLLPLALTPRYEC